MSYINDPREMAIRPESGVTLEQDNRVEEMYHWGAMVIDLCDMPVEEYMKPMTVIGLGGGGETPDTGTTIYTLKFMIDGVVVAQESLASGDPIPFSVNAEKENRTFLGWYYGGTAYTEGALMPSRNITLTAKYECNVSFVFVTEGNEEIVSAYSVSYNTKLSNVPSTNKPGYKFMGWEPNTASTIVEHTVFKATFEPIIYIVTWSGYTDGVKEETKYYGDFIYEPEEVPVKEGYTFNGWDKTFPIVVESDIKINAKFTINKYEISYRISIDGKEGEPISSTTLTYNSTIPSKTKPSQSGYTFSDWKGYNAETGEVFEGTKMPAYNVKYVSERTTNEYILSYFDNNELIRTETYLYGAEIVPYVYVKEGWTISEWSNIPEDLKMPYYDVSAHCVSIINTYTITFKDQDDNEYIVEAVYGTPIKEIVPVIEGKTFNITEDILNSTVGAEDLIIEGEVIVNNYKVQVEGVEGVEELPYGTNVEEYFTSNYPAEEGYHIIVESNHETVPADDSLVVKVTYKANIWILSYSTTGANDKDLNGSKEVAYNTLILPELPETSLEGYNFMGWFKDGQQVTNEDTMPNNNLSATGVYEIMSFVIIVKDGEVEVLNKEYTYGTKLQVVLDDIKEYREKLYNEGYETTVNINPEDVIKSSMEINIERIAREFELVFKNVEEIISASTVKVGTIIEYPNMSARTENGVEYIFVWEDDSYNGKPMSAHNLTIVGSYQEKTVAPIYYGIFVTSSTTPSSLIYNESDFKEFKTVLVADCLDGEDIAVEKEADDYLLGDITDNEYDSYSEEHLYPSCIMIPVTADAKYDMVVILKADNKQKNFTSDKVEININGENYYLYTYLTPWPNMAAQDMKQKWTYNITLKNK